MAGLAYVILQQAIIRDQGEGSLLRRAVHKDIKGKASAVLYAAAVPLAFVSPWISVAIYIGVAVMWIIPDRRIARTITGAE